MSTKERVGWWIGGALIILYCLFPIAWIVSLSFKTTADLANKSFLPSSWTWENYSTILTGTASDLFLPALRNSFGICLIATFISLLLLAGLAQVPDVLQEAAQVDGATWWQRMWRVTIPNMKAAIMVALLFRTLDAFRIFDSIFIMTAGANNTESVSFLAYRQTISRVEIGLGSAVSVLLFLAVVLIAFVFIKGFKVDLAGTRGDN